MATFNDIQHEIKTIIESLETCDEDQYAELEESALSYLDDLANAEAEKIDAYAYVMREQAARIEFIKSEEKRLAQRRRTAENALSAIKQRLISQLEYANLKKVAGNTSTVSLRKSKSVFVGIDAESLPEGLRTQKTTFSADKKAIKAALESGENIEGCSIEEGTSLLVR